MRFFLIIIILGFYSFAFAQQTFVVKGVLIDGETKETLPLVPILADSLIGQNTNLDGEFTFRLNPGKHIFLIRYAGYTLLRDTIELSQDLTHNLVLEPLRSEIQEVVITGKQNPAIRIMKNAIKHKKYNTMAKLESYDFNSYNKLVISLDNITDEKVNNSLAFKPMKKFIESHKSDTTIQDTLPNKYKLAIFISESYSKVFYKRPDKKKEIIEATQSSGVQNSESNLLSTMLTGINIYDNYVRILGKQFISPVADGAFLNYNFEIVNFEADGRDTVFCIELLPKSKFDLAFKGKIYIENKDWAVKRVDVRMNTDPNINFVEGIRVRQAFAKVDTNWVTTLSDVEVDFKNSEKRVGLIGRTSSMHSDFILNQPKPDKFYNEGSLEIDATANNKDSSYWTVKRMSPLENSEKLGYALIDSLKQKSIWQVILLVSQFVTTGKKKFKYFELGPYAYLFTFNAVEGPRNRISINTTPLFNKQLYLGGHVAYGWKDRRWKYNIDIRYKFVLRPRYEVMFSRMSEVEQTGYPNYVNEGTGIMTSLLFRVPLIQQNYFIENQVKVYGDLTKGLSCYFYARTRAFQPAKPFAFSFLDRQGLEVSKYRTTEIGASFRISFRENYILKANEKVFLGSKYPQFYVDLAMGVPHRLGRNLLQGNHGLGGDFRYYKITLAMSDRFPVGRFGYINYTLTVGKIWGKLPYPSLHVFRGSQSYAFDPMGVNLGGFASAVGTNRSMLYDPVSYNLMYYYEFIADQFLTFGFDHHLEGFFLRKIPLIQKLKLKEVWTGRLAYGSLSQANKLMNTTNTQTIQAPDKIPYMEIGVGLENILKLFRVDFVWRLTYKNPVAPARISKYNYNYGVRVNFSLGF